MHSGGKEREKPESAHRFSAWTENNPSVGKTSSINSCFTCERLSSVGSSGSSTCTVYGHTHTHTHRERTCCCTDTQTKKTVYYRFSTFSTIPDVPRRLAWTPGYDPTRWSRPGARPGPIGLSSSSCGCYIQSVLLCHSPVGEVFKEKHIGDRAPAETRGNTSVSAKSQRSGSSEGGACRLALFPRVDALWIFLITYESRPELGERSPTPERSPLYIWSDKGSSRVANISSCQRVNCECSSTFTKPILYRVLWYTHISFFFFQNKSTHKLRLGFFFFFFSSLPPAQVFLWMSKAPYDAMIAYISLRARSFVVNHLVSGATLESSNSGVKMPYSRKLPWTFKTRYKMKSRHFSFVLRGFGTAASDPCVTVWYRSVYTHTHTDTHRHTQWPCCRFISKKTKSKPSHLLQTSAPWTLCSSSGLEPRHQWEWLNCVFVFFGGGGTPVRKLTNEEFPFFPRLPIRTIRFLYFFFYHWFALITLISLGNDRLRKNKMNECSVFFVFFPSLRFGDYMRIISGGGGGGSFCLL